VRLPDTVMQYSGTASHADLYPLVILWKIDAEGQSILLPYLYNWIVCFVVVFSSDYKISLNAEKSKLDGTC
jgi:hypothetical protein